MDGHRDDLTLSMALETTIDLTYCDVTASTKDAEEFMTSLRLKDNKLTMEILTTVEISAHFLKCAWFADTICKPVHPAGR